MVYFYKNDFPHVINTYLHPSLINWSNISLVGSESIINFVGLKNVSLYEILKK